MAKQLMVVLFLFMLKTANGQYFKIDNGISLNSFQNKKGLYILSDRISSYSFSLGVDYLQKDWFYLSSQVGYLKIGGQETNAFLQGSNANVSENKNYMHINTVFRAYLKSSNLKIFLGAGPYLNFLIGNKKFDSSLYNPDYTFKDMYAGGRTEIGVTEDVSKFRVGLVGSYMFNLTPSASSDFLNLNNNTFLLSLTAGYSF